MFLMLYRLMWEALYPLLWAARPLAPGHWKLRERFCASGRIQVSQDGGTQDPVAQNGDGGQPGTECLWFHCASLGEAKGLLGLLSLGVPGQDRLLLTAATASGVAFLREEAPRVLKTDGMENRNSGIPAGHAKWRAERGVRRVEVAVAPLDHLGVLRRWIHIHRPRALCLYEMEWWPHALLACRQSGIPVLGVSVRFGTRIRKVSGVARRLAGCFSYIQTQTKGDADALEGIGIPSREANGVQNGKPAAGPLEVGVDYKYVYYRRLFLGKAEKEGSATTGRSGLALVSLHHRELLLFLPHLKKLQKEQPNKGTVYILPRHLRELPRFKKSLEGFHWSYLSSTREAPIRLADRMGCVETCLRKVRTCFVGGSWIPVGGHNLWEPFLLGVFTYVGPYHQNQISALELMKTCGMVKVLEDLRDVVREFLSKGGTQETADLSGVHAQLMPKAGEAHMRWARRLEADLARGKPEAGGGKNGRAASGRMDSGKASSEKTTHPRQHSRQFSDE